MDDEEEEDDEDDEEDEEESEESLLDESEESDELDDEEEDDEEDELELLLEEELEEELEVTVPLFCVRAAGSRTITSSQPLSLLPMRGSAKKRSRHGRARSENLTGVRSGIFGPKLLHRE